MTHLFNSYDGVIFHDHPDTAIGHCQSTLANFEGSPLAVGGYNGNNNRAETLDIVDNTWTEVAAYPYHN